MFGYRWQIFRWGILQKIFKLLKQSNSKKNTTFVFIRFVSDSEKNKQVTGNTFILSLND